MRHHSYTMIHSLHPFWFFALSYCLPFLSLFLTTVSLLFSFILFPGIDLTPGGVLCEEQSRAVRKLESNTRLQSNRLKDIIDGLEAYIESSIEQVTCSLKSS